MIKWELDGVIVNDGFALSQPIAIQRHHSMLNGRQGL